MPDPDPNAPPADPPKPPPDPPEPKDPPDPAAEAEKWKAMARKHEAEAKKNAEAAKKLTELEDASKTELQRFTDKATAAESRAAEAEARALRLEVATEKGLSAAQSKRLVGTTREELEADAEELLESFGGEKPKPSDRPKERLRGGSDPSLEPEETDPRKLAALIPRR